MPKPEYFSVWRTSADGCDIEAYTDAAGFGEWQNREHAEIAALEAIRTKWAEAHQLTVLGHDSKGTIVLEERFTPEV